MKRLLLMLALLCGVANGQNNKTVGSITESSAACGAPNGCVTLELTRNVGAASILVTGIFVATLQFEKSVDGVTYVAANGIPQPTGGAVSSATAVGSWAFDVPSFSFFRVRASAYTSGTAVVTIKTAELSGDGIDAVSGAVSPGTASATTLGGMPMICDSATSGTVTAGQAQMVRCTPAGILSMMIANQNGDTVSSASEGALVFAAGTVAALQVTPKLFNGTNFSRPYVASLANFPAASTLTARNSAGAQVTEKGSRWMVISNPAAGSQATASIASEASVRHVVDCISFSAAATAAPAATALTINVRDGATGAGTIIWTFQTVVTATTGQLVAPHSMCGLNLTGTTATAMTLEFSASLANLIESVSISGYNVN